MAAKCSTIVQHSLARLQDGDQHLSVAALLKALTGELGQYIGHPQHLDPHVALYAKYAPTTPTPAAALLHTARATPSTP